MAVEVFAVLLLVSGVIVSAALPMGRRWLLVLGLVGSMVSAGVLWAVTDYGDVEVPAWYAAAIFVVVFGGPWALGVAIGVSFREVIGAWVERRRWH